MAFSVWIRYIAIALASWLVCSLAPGAEARTVGKASGKVTAKATPGGTFSFGVRQCSADRASPDGPGTIDLSGAGGFNLHLISSGEETQLSISASSPPASSIPISKEACSLWDVAVHWVSRTRGHESTVSGHVLIDCSAGNGRVSANVKFDHCPVGEAR